jgi:hypothetical protein
MSIELRVVNYTSTDEDGEKIYTRHAFQTRRKDGPWTDVPVTEIYEERVVEEEKIYIVDRAYDILMDKLKDDLVASRAAVVEARAAYVTARLNEKDE